MGTEAKSVLAGKFLPGRFHDANFIAEYGRIEALRSARYNTCFSVVLMDIENNAGGHAGVESLEKLAITVLDSFRDCDVVGLAGDGQMIAILPETDHFGSLAAVRKLNRSISTAVEKAGLNAVISQSTYPRDGRGYGEVLTAAAARIAVKRASAWERLRLKERLFWEIIGEMAARPPQGEACASFEAGSGQVLSEFFIDQINEFIIREIMRDPQRRGILYLSSKKISTGMPVIKNLNSAGTVATKIFLIGEAEGDLWDIRNATPIFIDDPRLKEAFFTFYLNEDSAYGLVCKENWGATFSCFHTSDPVMVEGLITKFQGEYSLQEQLG